LGDRSIQFLSLFHSCPDTIGFKEDAKQDSAIEEGELLVDVYGKPLLFLQNNGG
jgi:hypothetical protein